MDALVRLEGNEIRRLLRDEGKRMSGSSENHSTIASAGEEEFARDIGHTCRKRKNRDMYLSRRMWWQGLTSRENIRKQQERACCNLRGKALSDGGFQLPWRFKASVQAAAHGVGLRRGGSHVRLGLGRRGHLRQ